jgi:hypothetical protein
LRTSRSIRSISWTSSSCPAQDHDPAVGVDADLSLGKRPVAKQLALHLAHETDIVHLWCALRLVRDRMREPDDLARLVMGLALNPPGAAAERSPCTVANEVPSARAVARVKEELQRDPRRHTGRGGRGELSR